MAQCAHKAKVLMSVPLTFFQTFLTVFLFYSFSLECISLCFAWNTVLLFICHDSILTFLTQVHILRASLMASSLPLGTTAF